MKSAEERRALLEELLQRVKGNRANLEQARLVEPAVSPEPLAEADEPIEPEPVQLAPAEPEPVEPEPVEPEPVEPEPVEPEPVEPEPVEPEPVEPEPAEPAISPEPLAEADEAETLMVEVKTAATAPVAAAEGSRPREWTIEAVLQRAWDLGTPRGT
jgi:hypothetical protein